MDKSTVLGVEHLQSINASLEKGHNAIFLANHQTEADPQAISILLEKISPEYAEKLIFVAGERVITDPLAVPLAWGATSSVSTRSGISTSSRAQNAKADA